MWDDVLDANHRYRTTYHDPEVSGVAARGLAILTCIDSRIDPLAVLGLEVGDAKILRTAGARVTDDALRGLILATTLLGATRVCVVQHTDCAVVGSTEDELAARVTEARGVEASALQFLATPDQIGALQADIERLASCDLLARDVHIAGFVLDLHTGELRRSGIEAST